MPVRTGGFDPYLWPHLISSGHPVILAYPGGRPSVLGHDGLPEGPVQLAGHRAEEALEEQAEPALPGAQPRYDRLLRSDVSLHAIL